jgi:hypothetical protein
MAADSVELDSHWLKSLEKVPKVSSITITKHLTGCGKKEVGEKGYKFFTENYIHNVFVKEDYRGSCFVKALCFRSQRKSEAPHAVNITLKSEDGRGIVTEANCSCKAA